LSDPQGRLVLTEGKPERRRIEKDQRVLRVDLQCRLQNGESASR
jgi:hypothetical protein